jgi:glucose 1-dehydrogenase
MLSSAIEGLRDQRVLVTGASSGIGAGIARAFGACGARVMIHYRSTEAGAARTAADVIAQGGEAMTVQADLRDEAAIEQLFGQVDTAWGGLDILVNNAGIVHKGSALETTAGQWDETLNINLRAPFLLSRQAARRMIAAGQGGNIVNITSIAGTRSAESMAAYAASKAALDALTRILALEWAPAGIRVNAVAPGVVPVERQQERLYAATEMWMQHIPLGRFGEPADVAALVVFLCSDAASWITGQTYICDGGALARSNSPRQASRPS